MAGTHLVARTTAPADFGVVYDAINRFATAETRSIDFDVDYVPADGWTLHFKVGYTDAEGNTDAQPFVEFGAPAAFTYDLRGRAPQCQLRERRSDAIRTTCSSSSARCTRS